MNKAESKYFNTAARMDEAFLALLEEKDYDYITIKELCKKAQVNRSTFYLHYENMNDLLSESVSYIIDKFVLYFRTDAQSMISKLSTCPLEELNFITPEYLSPYLAFIAENKRLFSTVMKKSTQLGMQDAYSGLFRHVFAPILERFGVAEGEREYMMTFYVSGLIAVVSRWLQGGCSTPTSELIAIIQRCIGASSRIAEVK